MPSNYDYPNDGKLHCRYSELVKCTPVGVQQVVLDRRSGRESFENLHTILGIERHRQCAEESMLTGKVAHCFVDRCPELDFTHDFVNIEQELIAEIFPGIVLHSTPDYVGITGNRCKIVDYKFSASPPSSFAGSKQHLVYAFQMLARGIICTDAWYGVEKWNQEKTEIYGHVAIHVPLNRMKIISVRPWLWDRVCTLEAALETMEVA